MGNTRWTPSATQAFNLLKPVSIEDGAGTKERFSHQSGFLFQRDTACRAASNAA